MEKRKFLKDALIHCYQRTADGSLCFYTVSDYLVFFTLVCVAARRYNVRIIKLCPMPDHYHISCICDSAERLAAFQQFIESVYAREFNDICGRKGRLFQKPFGSAPKRTDKAIRTNLIYVDNNPRERNLCSKSEEWRWNFVAYAMSDYPFSKKIDKRKAPSIIKNAMKIVEALHGSGKFLRHAMLYRMFSKLSRDQRESLIDFIISTYSVIDYQYSIEMFGSYDNMLVAEHASAGKEFDIREHFNGKRDDVYKTMAQLLIVNGFVSDIHEVVAMDDQGKKRLKSFLIGKTPATLRQIECFLHLPAKPKS